MRRGRGKLTVAQKIERAVERHDCALRELFRTADKLHNNSDDDPESDDRWRLRIDFMEAARKYGDRCRAMTRISR